MKTLITARFDPAALSQLTQAGFEIEQAGFGVTGEKLAEKELADKLTAAEVAIIEFELITEEILAKASKLKLLACCRNEPAASIDIEAATKLGIPVIFTPGRNAVSVAEYTLALMLTLAKSIGTTHHLLRYTDELTNVSYNDKGGTRKSVTSEWSMDKSAPFARFQSDELMGQTVGLVGAGFIGQEIAKRVQALGMNVIAFDPYANAQSLKKLNIELVDLDSLSATSDFVVMAAKVTDESRGIFSSTQIAKMKSSAYFINTARAALVDYPALESALAAKKIAGAGFDVYPVEPLPSDSPLRSLDNVVLSPHLAGASRQVVLHHSKMVVDDLLEIKNGRADGPLLTRIYNSETFKDFMLRGGLG